MIVMNKAWYILYILSVIFLLILQIEITFIIFSLFQYAIFLLFLRFLQTAGFIIFLNKQDKLREKVVQDKKSLTETFPEYATYELHKNGNR